MTTKTLDHDIVNISSFSSTASEDTRHIRARRKKTSISTEEVQFGIGADDQSVISQEQETLVTKSAREFLKTYPNQEQEKQARMVLSKIEDLLGNYDVSEFPEIGIFSGDDGTLGMQWDVADTTLGIGIDPAIDESYWFLLSGEKDKDIRAKGSLRNMDILIPWLIWLLEKKQMQVGE